MGLSVVDFCRLCHSIEARKTFKKGRITGSTVTSYGGFRRDELDTEGRVARRIFLWEGVVQGRGRQGACEGQCKRQKKAKKRRITESAVTPTYGGFRRDELDTVADWGWRIFLWKEVVQGGAERGACGGQCEN